MSFCWVFLFQDWILDHLCVFQSLTPNCQMIQCNNSQTTMISNKIPPVPVNVPGKRSFEICGIYEKLSVPEWWTRKTLSAFTPPFHVRIGIGIRNTAIVRVLLPWTKGSWSHWKCMVLLYQCLLSAQGQQKVKDAENRSVGGNKFIFRHIQKASKTSSQQHLKQHVSHHTKCSQ